MSDPELIIRVVLTTLSSKNKREIKNVKIQSQQSI